MIVSITCRHNTENKMLRRRVGVECLALARYMPTTIRIQVVFYKESYHSKSSDLIACHISIQAPHKQHIDIYEYQPNENLAFHKALERATSKLLRLNARRPSYVIDRHTAYN